MKKKYYSKFVLYLTVFIMFNTSAQIRSGSSNIEKSTTIRNVDKKITLSKTEVENLRIQDSIDISNGMPYRFGKDITVDVNFVSKASRKIVENKNVLSYSIECTEAFSVNLIFNQIKLTESSELNIYSEDRKFRYGPITKSNNTNGLIKFWTDLIPGSLIHIELTSLENPDLNVLNISKVIYGYENSFGTKSFGSSASCNIDVNCPEGSGWELESSSVSMILLANGTRWCSSALVNNTAKDYKGYILSAFHCIDLDQNQMLDASEKAAVNNWMFRFKYESASCNGIDDTNFMTFNGSNFVAAYDPTDFLLLELFNTPNANDCISYSGWSRESIIPLNGTGIHHPKGDVKKYL